MWNKPVFRDKPQARVIQVIEVAHIIGKGTEGNLSRAVYDYFSLDGELLARRDEWAEAVRGERQTVGAFFRTAPATKE